VTMLVLVARKVSLTASQ